MRQDRTFAMAELGDFKFVFDDPNKNYIEFVGGTLNIKLTAAVNINCNSVSIKTAGPVSIQAGGPVTINGSTINLN